MKSISNFSGSDYCPVYQRISKKIATVLGSLIVSACGSVPVASDGPLLRPSELAQDIKVEQRSSDIICVTAAGETTCVPVVHGDFETPNSSSKNASAIEASVNNKAGK